MMHHPKRKLCFCSSQGCKCHPLLLKKQDCTRNKKGLAWSLLTVVKSRSNSCRFWKWGGFLASDHPGIVDGSLAPFLSISTSSFSCSLACFLPALPFGVSALPAPAADKAWRKSASVSKHGTARTRLGWYKPAEQKPHIIILTSETKVMSQAGGE